MSHVAFEASQQLFSLTYLTHNKYGLNIPLRT